MAPFGIRFESDATGPDGPFIVDSVELLNEQLAPEGKRFFFDTADLGQRMICGRHCWDMFGWVVPEEEIDRFMPDWLAWRDDKLHDFSYVTIDWTEKDGRPYAEIGYDDWMDE